MKPEVGASEARERAAPVLVLPRPIPLARAAAALALTMPRWWSGGPSSPAAVTDTASEDAAHMASISAAINQGTEQRHERQLKLRRLLTQVVIVAREEAGRCLSLVRTCVTERARFERAHKSPALAAADTELAAVREAEGKARANEEPFQSALALVLQDGSSNALPEYDAVLPSGGTSGEYEQLKSRARAAAARADAWVTHLIDEHKGLRFSVMLTARSLARANPIAPASEGAAADGAVLPSAEASAAATAAVENAKQQATASLIATPSAEDAECETLATCRRRLANHLDRLRFAADVAQAVAGLQWAAAPPRAPAALPPFGPSVSRAPSQAPIGPSATRAPYQAPFGPSVSRAPAPKLAPKLGPICASKPTPPRGAVASASTRPVAAADRSDDRPGSGRKRGAVDGAPEAAEGGGSQAAGDGSSKRGRNNGAGGRKDADAGQSSPADVGDASSGASGGGYGGGGNDDGSGGDGGVTNDAMGGMEVEEVVEEEEEDEDEEEEGEEMVMQLAAVEVPEDAHEDALGSAAKEAVDEAAVAEAAGPEEPLTQELPSDESGAHDGADGGSEAAEQDAEDGEAAETAGVAAEEAAAENGHGHDADEDEDDEDEAREENVPDTAPVEPAPAGARPAPPLPSQAARREATVQGWVQELSAFNAPSRASAMSVKASRLAQELADVELLCDATAALREELESAAVSAAAIATLSAVAPPAAAPPTPDLDGPPSKHGRARTGQGNAKSDAKGKGTAKASARRFDLFDDEGHEEAPPPPLPPPSAVRRSTVALGAATVAALKAALAALAPSDPRAWDTLADVCRFVCLSCVDTPSAKGAGRGGRGGGAGVASSTPTLPPPDWKAYQQRFEDFFPRPSPPQKTLELPPPLAEARVQLRAYLYESASAPPGALLPPPPFTSARLDAFALVDAVTLLEKGLTAKAARLGGEAGEARQAADAAMAAMATRGAVPPEAPLPFLLRLAAHHLAAAPVPGLSDGTAAIGAKKGGGKGGGNGATAPSAPSAPSAPVHSARVEPASRAKRPMEGKAAVAAPKAKVARQSKVRA